MNFQKKSNIFSKIDQKYQEFFQIKAIFSENVPKVFQKNHKFPEKKQYFLKMYQNFFEQKQYTP